MNAVSSEPYIDLRSIRKTYLTGGLDVEVLRGVSLEIRSGEFVALVGASGSGKSKLMNILGCLDRPTAGEYFMSGRNLSGLSSDERADIRSQEIGFVFQNFNLLPRTSALENVLMPLSYSRVAIDEAEANSRAQMLITRLGLDGRGHHEPSQLSGGQQQRVAIARALVNRPKLLFADEPTGNLDSVTADEVLKIFRSLNEEEGVTIVLVTHDADVARRADRTIRMKDGLIVEGAGDKHGAVLGRER